MAVNESDLDITFSKKKKIALLFICINERYWPYLHQVIQDCRNNFLPHHLVDFYVWTDIPQKNDPAFQKRLQELVPDSEFRHNSPNRAPDQWWGRDTIWNAVSSLRDQKNVKLIETEPVEWPAPTLMRYHLFLNEEKTLKGYDHVFYLDADMRVVEKISDEILCEGLTAAEHPMYSLRPNYIPPYEPNQDSTAYIHRLGKVIDENGKPRFKPYYCAGGFQGGRSKDFIKAMKKMKKNIDKDFDNNYVAIWNDESHWNKYLWDYKGELVVLNPSYVYPDSLIDEYYVPIWGQKYQPKIITLTKHFSLSKEAGDDLKEFLGEKTNQFQCTQCGDMFQTQPGIVIKKILDCPGSGKEHKIEQSQG